MMVWDEKVRVQSHYNVSLGVHEGAIYPMVIEIFCSLGQQNKTVDQQQHQHCHPPGHAS